MSMWNTITRSETIRAIGNELIEGMADGAENIGPVVSRTRVGGMLKYYHRVAA